MPKVTDAHRAARRQQIIDAAYRCFARKGFHQTTMRDIYDEVQLSPGAVYHYFDGKDAIIQASFEFDHDRSLERLDAASASDDPLQALEALIDFFFQGLAGAADLGAPRVNVQGWGEALVNPPLLETIRRVHDRFMASLSTIIAKGQALGQIDPSLDPDSLGRTLLSLYHGLELQLALGQEVDVDRYVTTVKRLMRSAAERAPGSASADDTH